MKPVLIPDLRLATTHPSNSKEAMIFAHHSQHKEVAFHARILPSTKHLPAAWVLPHPHEGGRDYLLLPLLRRFPFQRVWIFLDALDDMDSILMRSLQEVVDQAILFSPLSPSSELSSTHAIAESPVGTTGACIFFLPDPRAIFRHWKQRHHILTFGSHTPVGYRLVAPVCDVKKSAPLPPTAV